jgi:transketolase
VADGVAARVIDVYSLKPIDVATLAAAADDTDGRLVVVEDHHPEGGLGSAVLEALAETGPRRLSFRHLAVRDMPGSGTPEQLLDAAAISAPHIVDAAHSLIAAAATS